MSRPYNSNVRENRTMQKNITLIYGDCSSPEIDDPGGARTG